MPHSGCLQSHQTDTTCPCPRYQTPPHLRDMREEGEGNIDKENFNIFNVFNKPLTDADPVVPTNNDEGDKLFSRSDIMKQLEKALSLFV